MAETTYADLKAELLDTLRASAAIAESRGSSSVAESLRELDNKLVDERFNVVVVGEFKRGKTTFVNALLGTEILPAAVVPLTSVVTVVAHGPEVRAEVVYQDGRTEDIVVDSLSRYVTERENPGNELRVDRAVLHYPAEDLRDGVHLVDTPGVGSVYRHNTDVARAFLPEADAALFLTSADPPISEGERSFLEEVRDASARMFFVLNKADYLSEAERGEAVAFTEGVLEEALGRQTAVYPVSAREALRAKAVRDTERLAASGFPRFERDFREFLLREKGAAIVLSVAGQAGKLLADERNSLEMEERTLGIPERELAEKTREMERIFAEAERSREDTRVLLDGELRKLLAAVEADLRSFRDRDAAAVVEEIDRELGSTEDLREATAQLEDRIGRSVRRSVDRWRTEEEVRIAERFDEATERFVDQTNELVQRTVRLTGEVFGLRLEISSPLRGITPESRFTYSLREVPTMLESLLPDVRRYLPAGMARKLALREVRTRIPDLLDKHAGRLRWDFQQRLDRSRVSLQRTLDRRLAATIESLRHGVERAMVDRAASAERVDIAKTRLAEQRTRLLEIESRLGQIAERAAPLVKSGTA
ncbi:MAG: dynamin family protein [Actinomycetota bacterium]